MADKLARRLHDLPQELYDEIFDLTFTPNKAGHTVRILHATASPSCSAAHFVTHNDFPSLGQWLFTLPQAYFDQLKSVALIFDYSSLATEALEDTRAECEHALEYFEMCLINADVRPATWDWLTVEAKGVGKLTMAAWEKGEWAALYRDSS